MRFIVFMIPNLEGYEAGAMPSNEEIAAMTAYNEALVKAGVMQSGDGLAPPSRGARIEFPGGKAMVIDGPFTETKEVVGGFWLWQTKTREEAIAWALRCPSNEGSALELRQLFEIEDFASSPEVDHAFEVLASGKAD
jgi:hypothetical protein